MVKRGLVGDAKHQIMNERRRSIPLNPLRAFAVASRHSTFTAAANELGVTQVAISRQIAVLEDYLDAQLFERRSQSLRLTDVGRWLGQRIAPLFDEIETATLDLRDAEREHIVNLRTYPTFANHWLMPRLGTFKDNHPDFDVRLDTKVEPLTFRGTHLDVAIQLGSGEWDDACARELFIEEVDAVCSPAYAAQFDNFSDSSSIARAVLLHARYRRREWGHWARSWDIPLDTRRGYEFASSLLTYSAAINGLGIAMGQLALLEKELAEGTLVKPFNRTLVTGSSFWVVWPATVSVSTMTRRLIDWILVSAGRKPEFFSCDSERRG